MSSILSNLPVDAFVEKIAKRAVLVRAMPATAMRTKAASENDWLGQAGNWLKNQWNTNDVFRHSVYGAGAGGLAGLGSTLFQDEEDATPVRSALTGALGGAAIGGGLSAINKYWPTKKENLAPPSLTADQRKEVLRESAGVPATATGDSGTAASADLSRQDQRALIEHRLRAFAKGEPGAPSLEEAKQLAAQVRGLSSTPLYSDPGTAVTDTLLGGSMLAAPAVPFGWDAMRRHMTLDKVMKDPKMLDQVWTRASQVGGSTAGTHAALIGDDAFRAQVARDIASGTPTAISQAEARILAREGMLAHMGPEAAKKLQGDPTLTRGFFQRGKVRGSMLPTTWKGRAGLGGAALLAAWLLGNRTRAGVANLDAPTSDWIDSLGK